MASMQRAAAVFGSGVCGFGLMSFFGDGTALLRAQSLQPSRSMAVLSQKAEAVSVTLYPAASKDESAPTPSPRSSLRNDASEPILHRRGSRMRATSLSLGDGRNDMNMLRRSSSGDGPPRLTEEEKTLAIKRIRAVLEAKQQPPRER